MACVVRNLSVLSYAQGFTLWHYRANGSDPAALREITDDEFFNPAADLLNQGDMIHVSAFLGGVTLYVRMIKDGTVTTIVMAKTP